MHEKKLINVIRWLHCHPELAMNEHKTTEYIKSNSLRKKSQAQK